MKDKEFLQWIYARMNEVYKEDKDIDYMLKLKSIIRNYPEDKVTPNVFKQD